MKQVVCAVVINKGRVLVVRKKEAWFLPGGKPQIGEDDWQCLAREFNKELPKLVLSNSEYLNSFFGTAPQRSDRFYVRVYLVKVKGELTTAAARWVSKPEELGLNEITKKIIIFLNQNNYLQ
ncbi:MAG: NUDIX domain-containing protein [Candidatus Buchananbacteria bacterium]